jgi:hypothetical protein
MKRKGLGTLGLRKRRRYLDSNEYQEVKEEQYIVNDPVMLFLQQKCETEKELLRAKEIHFPFSGMSQYAIDKTVLLNLKRTAIQFEEKEWTSATFGCSDPVQLPDTVGFAKHSFLQKHALKSVTMHDLKIKRDNVILQNNEDPGWDKGVVFAFETNVVKLVFDHGLSVFHKTKTTSLNELKTELEKQEDLKPYFLGPSCPFVIEQESDKTFYIYRSLAKKVQVYFHGICYKTTAFSSDTVQQLKEHCIGLVETETKTKFEIYSKDKSHIPYPGESCKTTFPLYQNTESLNIDVRLANLADSEFVIFSGNLCEVKLDFENENRKIVVQLPVYAQIRDVIEAIQGDELKIQFHESDSLLISTDYLWDIMADRKSPFKLSFQVTSMKGFWLENETKPFYMGNTWLSRQKVSLLIHNQTRKTQKTIVVQKNCLVDRLVEKICSLFSVKSILLQSDNKDLLPNQFVGTIKNVNLDFFELKHIDPDTHPHPVENTLEYSLEFD